MSEFRLLDVAAVWLAGLFFFAGLMKAIRPRTARDYVSERLSVPVVTASVIIVIVSFSEMSIAASLILGIRVRLIGIIAAASLAVFSVLVLSDRDDLNCGCFGTNPLQPDRRGLIVTRNGTMLAAAVYVAYDGSAQPLTNPISVAVGTAVLVSSITLYVVLRSLWLDKS
jgi:uncharacterized membrane protein YphA (DoxX/SURF4 family)